MPLTPADAEMLKNYIEIVEPTRDGSGNVTGFNVDGVAISQTYTVADWTALNAIPKVAANDNLIVLVTGLGENGSLWRYNHSLGRWVITTPFMLYDKTFGAKGAGTNQVSSDGVNEKKFTLASTPAIPAGMLRAGSSLEVICEVGRVSGIVASVVSKVWLGTSATFTSNSAITVSTIAATAAHVSCMMPQLQFPATNKITTTYTVNPNGGSSSSSIQDFTTLIDTTAAMYFYPAVGISAVGDVFELLRFSVKVNNV